MAIAPPKPLADVTESELTGQLLELTRLTGFKRYHTWRSKPLGTTCSITFERGLWTPQPVLDDFFVSEAGTAYRIVGIEEGRTRDRFIVERVEAPIPGSRVFEFYWLPRERRAS